MEEAGEGKKGRREGGGHRCSFLIHDAVGENLFTEILLRLPLDDIFRCKAVCKRWLSLIQNPLFAACYTNKQKKKKQSSLSCIVYPHPQQKSPVLIPTYDGETTKTKKRLEFSLDFIPDLQQLLGADNYSDLLQQAADDKENFVKEQKRIFRSILYYNGLGMLRDGSDLKNMWIQRKPDDLDTKHPTRYYSTRNFVLGSSNGLLLCAPLLFAPRPDFQSTLCRDPEPLFCRHPEPVFDDFSPSYVVCNPYTKQWLQVPTPPPSSSSISPHAASVGFVSDFERGGCWFKIVRLPLDFESPHRRSLQLQVFSSYSWEWKTVRVSSLSQPIGSDNSTMTPVAVTLLNKDNVGGSRLCWLLNDTQAIVYDPMKDVVDAVIEVPNPGVEFLLDAICVSKGCLWAGSLRFQFTLRIYRVSGKEWEMVEQFDMRQIYDRMERYLKLKCDAFVGMNPDDPQQVYLRSFKTVALLNLKTKTYEVVGALEGPPGPKNCLQGSSIICDNPPWPTPLPSPPSPSSS